MRVTLVLPLPSESVGCFCKTMIKSKIEARERALEFVKPSDFITVEEQIECAKEIEKYLIGDADLPEVVELKKE